MNSQRMAYWLNFLIALVWLVNGLLCKVLALVPRHQRIVARILGEKHSAMRTKIIGASEVVMALWIVSGIRPTLNAIMQIVIIAVMNVMEFVLAHDLLLWGRFNAVFAFLFILLIFYNECFLR